MSDSTSSQKVTIAVLLGLVFPGAGHVVYGRRAKAILYFALILLTFVIGLWLGDWRVVSRERFPLYLIAQMWAAGPTALTLLATEGLRITRDIPYLDAGLLFTASAGLLNVVAMVDVYETHRRMIEGDEPSGSGEPGKPVGAE